MSVRTLLAASGECCGSAAERQSTSRRVAWCVTPWTGRYPSRHLDRGPGWQDSPGRSHPRGGPTGTSDDGAEEQTTRIRFWQRLAGVGWWSCIRRPVQCNCRAQDRAIMHHSDGIRHILVCCQRTDAPTDPDKRHITVISNVMSLCYDIAALSTVCI